MARCNTLWHTVGRTTPIKLLCPKGGSTSSECVTVHSSAHPSAASTWKSWMQVGGPFGQRHVTNWNHFNEISISISTSISISMKFNFIEFSISMEWDVQAPSLALQAGQNGVSSQSMILRFYGNLISQSQWHFMILLAFHDLEERFRLLPWHCWLVILAFCESNCGMLKLQPSLAAYPEMTFCCVQFGASASPTA